MKRRTSSIACTLCLLLTACFGARDAAELDRVSAARSGMRTGLEFLQAARATGQPLPAPRAGLRAGTLLSKTDDAGETVPVPSPGSEPQDDAVGADTRLLDTFLKLLRIDVPDLLNRSARREEALDEYIGSLSSYAQNGRARLLALRDREAALRDDERRLERGVRDLGNELDSAIRGGEAGRSSPLAREIGERRSALAKAQWELTVVSSLRASYEDILPPLEERLRAVKANRDPLVKGVRVVDIPGVEDLRIIILEEGRLRVRRRR